MFSIPTIDLVQTGANIVRLRKAAGLTVRDLQTAFGFNSPQAIYKWQNGAALPTVDNLMSVTWGKIPRLKAKPLGQPPESLGGRKREGLNLR